MLRQVTNLLLNSSSSCPEWFQLCLLSILNRPAKQDSMHLKPRMSKSDHAQRWLIKLMKLILMRVNWL
jgi:membrane-anchored glycerophosphoryl diester phosphodiesterase (GDPDase)